MMDINSMTLEQKIGMVLCARRFEPEDIEFIKELIRKRALGSVQLPAHKPEIVKEILSVTDYPIIVVNDTETGFPTTQLPKAPVIALSSTGKKEYLEAFARGIVRDGKKLGFNATWGPIIDILHGDGPCSVFRKFSDDPDTVMQSAEVIARVFKDNGYLSCGKHYPGGNEGLPFDTHMAEGICYDTKEDLLNNDLVPYKYLLEKDLLPTVMVGHTLFPNIDPDYPASLSKKVIDILRDDIGFDGVLFTDSFAMFGILQKYGEENIYGLAMAAGVDNILPNYDAPVREVYNMLMQNYKDGAFTIDRLNEAVRRVLKAQEFVGSKPQNPTPFTKQDEETVHNIVRDCITAITDEGVSAKLDNCDDEKLFVVMKETIHIDENDGREINITPFINSKKIADKIKETFPKSEIVFLPEFPQYWENAGVLRAASKHKEVIFVTYCNPTAYIGTDSLTRRVEAVINALVHSKKVSTIVHFGNPYALKPLLHIPRKIFGFTAPQSQLHAIDVLKGTIEAKGTLQIKVDFQ